MIPHTELLNILNDKFYDLTEAKRQLDAGVGQDTTPRQVAELVETVRGILRDTETAATLIVDMLQGDRKREPYHHRRFSSAATESAAPATGINTPASKLSAERKKVGRRA